MSVSSQKTVSVPATISRSGGPSDRAVGAMIREAISIGVPVYNDGDAHGCAEVYRECLEDILSLQGALDGDTRLAVEEVLRKLPSQPSDDKRAWVLRHTLDAILAGGLQPPASPSLGASDKSHSAARSAPAEKTPPSLTLSEKAAPTAASSAPAAADATVLMVEDATVPNALFTSAAAAASGEAAGKDARTLSEAQGGGQPAKEEAESTLSTLPARETAGVSAEVTDDGWEEELACSICLEFLWDPVKLRCGHHFCRCCLLRTTQLSPDGGRCPNCRAKIDVDPNEVEADADLQATVHARVPADERLLRSESARRELERLRAVQVHTIPIFAMSPGVRPGDPVSLNLFEPRYREMARRIMAPGGNKLFVFVGSLPASAASGCLVLVERSATQINGNTFSKVIFYSDFTESMY
jgi:hypothetical protein